MQWLVDVVRGLVIVVFFVYVAQALLPDSGLRGYARLVMGLLVVAALLTPVLELLRLDYPLQRELFAWAAGPDWPFAAGRGPAAAGQDPVVAGHELAAAAQARVAAVGRTRFGQQVGSIAALAAGVEPENVEVTWGTAGAPAAVRITFAGSAAPPELERVRRLVAQFFGLDPAQVAVDRAGR